MAFLVKTQRPRPSGVSNPGFETLQGYVQVSCAAQVLPQTASYQIFRTFNGRCLVHLLYGEVTVVLTSTDPGLSFLSARLTSAASPAVSGTAVTIASTTNIASLEVGGNVTVLGSGAAFIKNNAGAGLATLGRIPFVVPQGEIYITTTGNNTTGQMKFDCWYQPLDPGAYMVAAGPAVAAI